MAGKIIIHFKNGIIKTLTNVVAFGLKRINGITSYIFKYANSTAVCTVTIDQREFETIEWKR